MWVECAQFFDFSLVYPTDFIAKGLVLDRKNPIEDEV